MESVTELIEKLRVFQGLTKRDLARKTGISEEYYWRIVTGKAPGCAYNIISSLCQSVGIVIIHSIDPNLIKKS